MYKRDTPSLQAELAIRIWPKIEVAELVLCLYMYTGPTSPPEATSATSTCPAEASLYSWSVPVQLERTNIRIYELCARHSHISGESVLYLFSLTVYDSADAN
jgi:hypothetical protein